MLKVVKRPKEYIAIKVPEDCEDIGKFVSNEFKRNNIPLEVTVHYKLNTGKVLIKGEQVVTAGDVIVVDYDMLNGYSVRVMSRKDFDIEFKSADATPETSPTLTAIEYLKGDHREGIAQGSPMGPDLFKNDINAELDRALTDYQQKQERSSQRASMPHVRIDIDNIHDIPHVWIDGERVDDLHGDKKPALSRVYVNWRAGAGTDAQSGKHEFVIQHYERDGYNVPKEIKTGERSITDKDD